MNLVNQIFNIDCREFLRQIRDNMFDMIVTSPPYFAGKDYNEFGYYKTDNLKEEWECFISTLIGIFKGCVKTLKPGGKLVINIDDKHTSLKNLGKNIVLPSHSALIMGLKDVIDYKEMILWKKVRGAHASGGSLRMLGSYGRFRSPGEIPIVQEVEYVLVFRKEGKRDITDKMRKESALTPNEFKQYGMQIWNIPAEKNRLHPAPYPVELPSRLIKMHTFKNDLVFDPFMGSGTTAVACIKNSRNYCGTELKKEYYVRSLDRIKNEKNHLFS